MRENLQRQAAAHAAGARANRRAQLEAMGSWRFGARHEQPSP